MRARELEQEVNKEIANEIGHTTLKNIQETQASLPYDYSWMDRHSKKHSTPFSKNENCDQKTLQAQSILEFLESMNVIDKNGRQLPHTPIVVDAYAGYGALGNALRQMRPDARVLFKLTWNHKQAQMLSIAALTPLAML